MLCYPIDLTPDETDSGEQSFLVTCPSLPEVATFGDARGIAALRAIGAIEEAIAARISEGSDIPGPIDSAAVAPEMLVAPIPLLTALKIVLYREARARNVTRAELCRRLGWKREQVERLFRIDHASRLDQLEAAFRALGARISITLEH
ncbi:MAG: type II toxin-antitoxin system HicB family antitoxin, partial [Methylocystis sp.]|nr:type II toxin-antitoxin system HicB family antitoxin [Methylocystis sp.]